MALKDQDNFKFLNISWFGTWKKCCYIYIYIYMFNWVWNQWFNRNAAMFKNIISEFNEVYCQCIVKMLRHFEEINLLQAMEFVVNDNDCLANHLTTDLTLQRMTSLSIKTSRWNHYFPYSSENFGHQKQLIVFKKVKACSIYFVFEPYIFFVKQPGVTLSISPSQLFYNIYFEV